MKTEINPTTTGEWTAEYVAAIVGAMFDGAWIIAHAHNAAVKEAYKKGMEDGIKAAGLTTRI